MKKLFNPTNLPLWAILTGGLGLLLRIWLVSSVDHRGFLVTGHIAAIALFVLVIGVLAALLFLTRDLVEANKYSFNFPVSNFSAAGIFAAAAGILLCSFMDIFSASNVLELVAALFGIAAAMLLVYTGFCRRGETAPSLLIHIGICVYLMLQLISYYRHWNSDPQILDYCFPLAATACLMLSAFQRASFSINAGQRRPHAFFSMAAVFFSAISMVGWTNIVFFLSVIVWQISDTCSLLPLELDESYFEEEDDYGW